MSEEKRFFIGCDLGKRDDYTALCVVEKMGLREEAVFACRHAERLDLGTPYPEQAERAKKLYRAVERRADRVKLVVDATGVGTAVVDMLKGLHPVKVTITGGSRIKEHGYRDYSVPKAELASCVQVLLGQERLKFAEGLPLEEVIWEELRSFRVKASESGHARFEHRSGAHDDLVLALALALWQARRQRQGRVYHIV